MVSGDYSAATDGVDINASLYCLRSFFRYMALRPGVREKYERSLTAQELVYSDGKWSSLSACDDGLGVDYRLFHDLSVPTNVRQKNGQLMGCVLSFPILCVLNLATWLVAHPEEEADTAKVLVNGDDILFSDTQSGYQEWNDCLDLAGFQKSVGKNYVSPTFCSVNSQCFVWEGEGWKRVHHVMSSLLNPDAVRSRHAQTQVVRGHVDLLEAPLSDLISVLPALERQLLEGHSPQVRGRLARVFEKRLGPVISLWTGLQWYLPQHLGGLGLSAEGRTYKTTFAQQQLAKRSFREGLPPLLARAELDTGPALQQFRRTHKFLDLRLGELPDSVAHFEGMEQEDLDDSPWSLGWVTGTGLAKARDTFVSARVNTLLSLPGDDPEVVCPPSLVVRHLLRWGLRCTRHAVEGYHEEPTRRWLML